MQPSVEQGLDEEDIQCIVDNQLGIPLHLYKQQSSFLRFYQGLTLVFTLLVVLLLILFSILHLKGRSDNFLDAAPFSLFVLLGLVGLFYLVSETERVRSAHIVVCTHGLLLSEKRLRKRRVETVRWEDIRAVTRRGPFIREYSLIQREGKAIFISFYQNMGELIDQIQHYSEDN